MSQQDVTHTRSTENLTASFFRSKSRSVDHGFTTPYDLESLRSKVEGRFESVDKLSRGETNQSYRAIKHEYNLKITIKIQRVKNTNVRIILEESSPINEQLLIKIHSANRQDPN
ncbi:hypothetical protein PV326_005325 [Microctonus aethiopoides]|nr:hypothetical protein PV326_005325 [Microctonus aethiopoides]